MKRRKIAILLLCGTLGMAGVLAGCGANDRQAPGSAMGSEGGPGGAPGGAPGGQSQGVDSYQAATEFTSDTETEGETYDSTGTDENTVHVLNGAKVKLKDATITRMSSDSTGGDNASFYGVGAASLVTDGTLMLSGGTINTDAKGAAGVFAYGDGTAYVSGTEIKTTQDTSGGIHAAGGGTLYAYDCDVETNGESSAAVRSDRGGGKMVIEDGSYVSNGTGSPAVYSTADIAVSDASLIATGSEAVCIEGQNSLRLFDVELEGNMKDDSQNDTTWNVILYQSMSGDSEEGTATFTMEGGVLTAGNGGMFYTTNTKSNFYLNDVEIDYGAESEFLLRCTGNNNKRGWGTAGKNGADCNFTADDQELKGNIIYDSISNLNLYLENESTYTGAFYDDESCAGEGGDGVCNVYISEDSVWTVTADCTVTNLTSAGKIVDESGKTVTIKGADGKVYVQGDSSLTVTVTSFSEKPDFSGAVEEIDFEEYYVENPMEEDVSEEIVGNADEEDEEADVEDDETLDEEDDLEDFEDEEA